MSALRWKGRVAPPSHGDHDRHGALRIFDGVSQNLEPMNSQKCNTAMTIRGYPQAIVPREVTVDSLTNNWAWILLVVGFLALHLLGHRYRRLRRAPQRSNDAALGDARERHGNALWDEHASGSLHRHRGC